MQIFLSWSGERSGEIAKAVRDWLPNVIQVLKPWVSSKDIDKGARWSAELSSKLQETDFGIICLTPENLNAPWLLYETGALSKAVESSRVCPVLYSLEPTDITGPFSQFQMSKLDRDDILSLLHTINAMLEKGSLSEEQLKETFQLWWPSLESKLREIPSSPSTCEPKRSDRDILEEILELARRQSRESLSQLHGTFSKEREAIRKTLMTLTPRQEKALRMVYGIGEPPESLEKVCEKWGLTLSEFQKLHDKALRVFGSPERMKRLLADSSDHGPT